MEQIDLFKNKLMTAINKYIRSYENLKSKTRFLPLRGRVGITVSMHHLGSNEMLIEKAW